MIFYKLSVFFTGLVILWFGAGTFIRGGEAIANKFKIPHLIIGLTFGAIGTSLPELIVSWMAAGVSSTGISIGNAVGSNMANIGLAIGLGAVLHPVNVHKEVINFDYWILLFSGAVLYLFSVNNFIGTVESIFLVIFGIIYLIILSARGFISEFESEILEKEKESLSKGILFFVLGTIGLAFGAKMVVSGASELAAFWGLTETVIGISIVAVGTSLPEISVVIAGSFKKSHKISLGTIIGSNIFNIFFVAGGAGVISAIPLSPAEAVFQAPAVVLYTLIFFPLLVNDRMISRFEGVFLMLIYGIYLFFLI